MRVTIVVNASLEAAMQLAEQIELVSNGHIVSFVDQGNGSILFNLEEKEVVNTDMEVSELEYIDMDEYEYGGHYEGDYGGDDYDDYDSERSDINNHSLSQDARISIVAYDAIGVCEGCGYTGNVNGYQYCEYCWDDFIE